MKTPPEIYPKLTPVKSYIAVDETRWAPGATPEEAVEELRGAIDEDYEEFDEQVVKVFAVTNEAEVTVKSAYEFKWASP